MLIEKTMSPDWLSNTWLVADEPGGHAVLVDTGGPAEPILQKIDEWKVTVTHALCTHHHGDHVEHNELYRRRLGCKIAGGRRESHLFGPLDLELDDGDQIEVGGLKIRCLLIPGHTLGQMAFVMNDERVFTGDTLFKGSIGGTRAPGHTDFQDIRRSIMDILMALPHEYQVHPGHTEPTTVGEEWERNPFIRMWRGLDAPGEGRCTAMGEPATLRLRATDYDGGFKCWVRFQQGNVDDIVPGSSVKDVSA